MIYNILFWLKYDSLAQKRMSAHRALPDTLDGQSMPADTIITPASSLTLHSYDITVETVKPSIFQLVVL